MCKNTQQENIDNQSEILQKRDTYTLSYTFWTGALFLFICLDGVIERVFSLWVLFPIIGLSLTWTVIMFIGLCKNIYKQRWRRVASIVAAPIIVVLFFNMLNLLNVTPDRVRLEYNRSGYMKEVAAIQVTDSSPRLKIWYWGEDPDFRIPAGGTFHYLIYDDSDQIFLPSQSRSAECKRSFDITTHYEWSSDNDWNGNCRIKRLDRHFYLVTISI